MPAIRRPGVVGRSVRRMQTKSKNRGSERRYYLRSTFMDNLWPSSV